MKNQILITATCFQLAFLFGCASVPTAKNATLRVGDGPLIQAHRGGRHEYDDNAAGGFKLSLERGIRGFETDVRFTKDHHLVIMHDDNLTRTTNGRGGVEEWTLAELKKFRLKISSEPVPTLEEVLAHFKGRDDFFIELEMKAYPSKFYTPEVLEDYCRKLSATAQAHLAPGTYAFTCFNTNTLATMRRVAPDMPTAIIFGAALTDKHLEIAHALGCSGVSPLLKGTTREMVDRAHDEGFAVALWMVQNAEQYAEAKAKGADRVTSDYPHRVDQTVRRENGKIWQL